MSTSFLGLVAVATLLCLVQLVAALPWLTVLDPGAVKAQLRRPISWAAALLAVGGTGVILALFLRVNQGSEWLEPWGRFYGSLLQAQLTVDLLVLTFAVLLPVWPRGTAIALAAFREGVRQPMFWMLVSATLILMVLSLFIPYFTFGDDYKMVKQLGHDLVMLAAVAFGVIAASMSISEEIEGRTAITLMSKPVSRREFLIGKYVGILLASLAMTGLLGWFLNWALFVKPFLERFDEVNDPLQQQFQPWVTSVVSSGALSGEASSFLKGAGLWFADALAILPGLVIGFCQAMMLLAIAAALATRLPMVVSLVICLLLFFLGNLSSVLVQASEGMRSWLGDGATYDLVNFMARLFDAILPSLEYFNLGTAIIRDTPLAAGPFALYVAQVALYAMLYTAIALLFALILFEDRDLA